MSFGTGTTARRPLRTGLLSDPDWSRRRTRGLSPLRTGRCRSVCVTSHDRGTTRETQQVASERLRVGASALDDRHDETIALTVEWPRPKTSIAATSIGSGEQPSSGRPPASERFFLPMCLVTPHTPVKDQLAIPAGSPSFRGPSGRADRI